MKKIILAIIVVIIVFSFTLPLYADQPDAEVKDTTSKGCDQGYYSSSYKGNGLLVGKGHGVRDPSHGGRAADVEPYAGVFTVNP